MKRFIPILATVLFSLLTLVAPTEPAVAQERFILVIDGSGSMWGQVNGEPKIKILRRALGDVLHELKTNAEVGVIAYGHREKGNCADIEELVPPSPFNEELLNAAIANINPKGKTPLSESVRQAANALRFTEEKATVVILGDGKESCGQDPCAVAEELEQTGVDFTVHAIAFDIADEEGSRQLKCFANKTGGQFIAASNSVELVIALQEVKQEVAPEPSPTGVRLIAVDRVTGAPIANEVQWTMIEVATEVVHTFKGVSGLIKDDLPSGEYEIFAQSGDKFGEAVGTIKDGKLTDVTVAFSGSAVSVIQIKAATTPAGSIIEVDWQIDGRDDDILFVAATDSAENRYPRDDRQRHVVKNGKPATLVAPAEPGEYEIRYFSLAAGGILHRTPLTVTAAEVTIEGPNHVTAGNSVEISWSGPKAEGDSLFIAPVHWSQDSYPRDSSLRIPANSAKSAQIRAPGTTGLYEYRYYSYANGVALLSVPVEVALTAARVSAPSSAPAGSLVSIEFVGPGHKGDRLFIVGADVDANRYSTSSEAQAVVKEGSPATLTAPAAAGSYEVRYFSLGHGGLLAKAPITITEPRVELDAPRTATRGSSIKLRVRGPEAPGDLVFIAKPDWADNKYPLSSRDKFAINPGSGHFLDDDGFYVLDMVAPAMPGTYDIRYFSWDNGTVLKRRALIVR